MIGKVTGPSENMEKEHNIVDHVVEQSEFYNRHESEIHTLSSALNIAVLVCIVGSVALQSYINLENGRFPFNTGFLADMAYRADTAGDAGLALFVGVVVGLFLIFLKRLFLATVDNAAYRKFGKENLRTIKVVKPGEKNGSSEFSQAKDTRNKYESS